MASGSNPENQTLLEIAEYHNDAKDALESFMKSLFKEENPRFLGFTPSEFTDFLRGRIEETELRSSLTILAALEAAFRIDYKLRATRKYKDPLSREFRTIHKKKQARAHLDEDLLEPWVRHRPSSKALIGEFRSALHFRHWLAHGRYWKRPTHSKFDYLSLYRLADAVFAQLPLYSN